MAQVIYYAALTAPVAATASLATPVSYSTGVGTTTRAVHSATIRSSTTLPSVLPAASVCDAKNAVLGAEALQKVAGQPPLAPFAAMRP